MMMHGCAAMFSMWKNVSCINVFKCRIYNQSDKIWSKTIHVIGEKLQNSTNSVPNCKNSINSAPNWKNIITSIILVKKIYNWQTNCDEWYWTKSNELIIVNRIELNVNNCDELKLWTVKN